MTTDEKEVDGPDTVLEDLVVKGLEGKNPTAEEPSAVKNPGIGYDSRKLALTGEYLTRQVISLFPFCNFLCLLFSSSKSYTIAAAWSFSIYWSALLFSVSTSIKQTLISFKYSNAEIQRLSLSNLISFIESLLILSLFFLKRF